MSTRGRTQELIAIPGDKISTANSGLTTIQRSYSCATSYADTAESLLVPGYSPSDYPLTALQTPAVRTDQNGISTFACTFYGVLSTSQFYRFYDESSSLVQRANFTYLDYYFQVYNNINQKFLLTQDCAISYASPAITRSFVIPLTDPVKSMPPSVSQWSVLPVLGMALDGPTSTVPLGITVPSGELYPNAQDILSLYGYSIQINKFNATAMGACRLIEMEFVKIWKGNKKIVQPYYHDPANLQEGSLVNLSIPQDQAQNISGFSLSVSTVDFDPSRDTNGAAPITITFTGYTSYQTDYPFVGYYLTGITPLPARTTVTEPADSTQCLSWFNDSNNNSYTKLDPGTYTVNALPGTYTVNLLLLGENSSSSGFTRPELSQHGMAEISQPIKTNGVPGAPTITLINDPGPLTGAGGSIVQGVNQSKVYFNAPDNDGGSAILFYNLYQNFLQNPVTSVAVDHLSSDENGIYLTTTAVGINAQNPIYLAAVNAHGTGRLTPAYTGNS